METRRNLRKLTLLAGAALLSTGALATPVDESTVTATEIVKYNVPESATPNGARVLYKKLQAAAARVCSASMPATKIPAVDRACAAAALGKAVGDVGNPLVIALHQQVQGATQVAGVKPAMPAASETVANR